MLNNRPPHSPQKGSTILEGLIAIVIFSLGILGMIGLQASSMKASTQAKERIDASLIANERIAEMWLNHKNLSTYLESETLISQLPSGKRTTTVNGDQVTITITWQMPGEKDTQIYSTIARINGN